jgi:hypothetical protein
VAQLNAIPIGGSAIGLASDHFQTRWILVVIQAVRPYPVSIGLSEAGHVLIIEKAIGLIPAIMLAVWEIPLGAKYAASMSILMICLHQ